MAFGSPPAGGRPTRPRPFPPTGHGSPVSRVRAALPQGGARWGHREVAQGEGSTEVTPSSALGNRRRRRCPRSGAATLLPSVLVLRLLSSAASAVVRAWRPPSSVLGRRHNPSLTRPPPTAMWVHHLPFQLSTSARILLPPLGFAHSAHINSCRSWGRRWSLVLVLVDSCSTYLILVAAFVFGWSDLPSILCEAAIVGVCASRLTVLFSIWVMQKNEWMYWIWIQVVLYCEWTQYHWVDKSQEDGWTLLLFQSAVAILRRNKELWVFISIFAQVNFP